MSVTTPGRSSLGDFFNILNSTGDNALLQVGGGDQIFDSNSPTAELDQYVSGSNLHEQIHAACGGQWPRTQVKISTTAAMLILTAP